MKMNYKRVVDEFDKELHKKIIPKYFSSNRSESVINSIRVPLNDIRFIYRPDKKLSQFYNSLSSFWKNLFAGLSTICETPFKDIGIYGSSLIDLVPASKSDKIDQDVDIVIYGRENLFKLKNISRNC